MATPAQRTNTWILDEWYDQAVAGTQGDYVGTKELWTWGQATNYALGLSQPENTDQSSPCQLPGGTWTNKFAASYDFSIAVKTDGTLWAWGYQGNGRGGFNNNYPHPSSPKQVGTDTNWATVAAIQDSTFATKTDGTAWAMGRNQNGQLGQNDRTERSSPIQIPGTTWSATYAMYNGASSFIGAVKTDGTLWTWGGNIYGVLGQNQGSLPFSDHRSSPTQLGTATDWKKMVNVNSGSFMGAVKTDGALWAWGDGRYGMYANNVGSPFSLLYSSPVQIPGEWENVVSSTYNMTATKPDGTLWVWGRNDWGQLGQNQSFGERNAQSSPIQMGTATNWDKVEGGQRAIYVTNTNGELYSWGGYNQVGQLGTNDVISRSSPTQIPGTWSYPPVVGNRDNNPHVLGTKLA